MKTVTMSAHGPYQQKAVVIATFTTVEQANMFRTECENLHDRDMYAMKTIARNMEGLIGLTHRIE